MRTARGAADPGQQPVVGDRQVEGADHGVGGDALAVAVATPTTAPSERRSTSLTSTPRCTGTPASVSACAMPRGTACMPPSG